MPVPPRLGRYQVYIYMGTWHEGTYNVDFWGPSANMEMTFSFTGIAVYIYCILVDSPISTVITNLFFAVDIDRPSNLTGQFGYTTTMGASHWTYHTNALVYSATNLPNTNHTISMSGYGNMRSSVLFDYLIYTVSNGSDPMTSVGATPTASSQWTPPPATSESSLHSSTVNVAAIAGGVVGGVVFGVVAAATFLFVLYKRRRANVPRSLDLDGSEKDYHGNLDPSALDNTGNPPRQGLSHTTEALDDATQPRISPFTALPPIIDSLSSADVTNTAVGTSRSSSPTRSGKHRRALTKQIREKEEALSDLQRRQTLTEQRDSGADEESWREIRRLRMEVEQLQMQIAQREEDLVPPRYEEHEQ